jgi:O-antigen ligase
VLVPAAFGLYLILDLFFGMGGSMAQAVGKDPTLHDRTKIWSFLLGMHTNPVIGTGYQSFWLGPRLEYFWTSAKLGHINEAHNGYLEVFLELGFAGVLLMVGFLIASYRAIWRKGGRLSGLAVFSLAAWMILVFYNMSEAAFESGLLYSVFLLGAIQVPARAERRARVQHGYGIGSPKDSVSAPNLSLEPTNPRR